MVPLFHDGSNQSRGQGRALLNFGGSQKLIPIQRNAAQIGIVCGKRLALRNGQRGTFNFLRTGR